MVLEPFARGDEPHDDLVRVHLLDDPYRAMLPEGHPLADSDTVGLHRPRARGLGRGHGRQRLLPQDGTIDLCRRAGFTPSFVAQAVEFPAAQAYVAAGIGVGLVPVLALGAVHRGVAIRRLRREAEPGACGSSPADHLRDRPGRRRPRGATPRCRGALPPHGRTRHPARRRPAAGVDRRKVSIPRSWFVQGVRGCALQPDRKECAMPRYLLSICYPADGVAAARRTSSPRS